MRYYQPERMILVDRLAPRDARFFLDLGCACGHVSAYLTENYRARGVGLDVNTDLIKEARDLYPQLRCLVAGSGANLPFATAAFDLVLLLEVLEHVPDQEQLLVEISRVLKPGGWLLLSVPNRSLISLIDLNRIKFYLPTVHRFLYRVKHRGRTDGFRKEETHHRHYSLERLRALLGKHFDIQEHIYSGSLWYVFAVVFSAVLPGDAAFDQWREKWLTKTFGQSWGRRSANLAVLARKRGPSTSN